MDFPKKDNITFSFMDFPKKDDITILFNGSLKE